MYRHFFIYQMHDLSRRCVNTINQSINQCITSVHSRYGYIVKEHHSEGSTRYVTVRVIHIFVDHCCCGSEPFPAATATQLTLEPRNNSLDDDFVERTLVPVAIVVPGTRYSAQQSDACCHNQPVSQRYRLYHYYHQYHHHS